MSRATTDSDRSLPKGWRWVKLGDVCGFESGGTPAKNEERFWNGNIPFVTGADITSFYVTAENARAFLTRAGLESGKTAICRPGSVLFVTRTRVGRVGIAKATMGASQDITPLICGDEAYPEFVCRYLLSIGKHLVDSCRGATIQGLTRDFVESLEIPLPPLPEQKRIAAILNEQMAAVERARKAAEERLAVVSALQAAYLRAVFPASDRPLPEGWRWVKLGDVCDVVNGYGFAESFQGRTDLPYPFIKVSDMNTAGAEVVVSSAANTVDAPILRALGARTYPVGTVIFPKVGGALLTNKKRVLGCEATFDNNVMGIVSGEVESTWIYFWIQTIDLGSMANTQALPSIRQSVVSALSIPLPPVSEQKRIAAILNEQMAAVERARKAAEGELETINALPAALLRRAFAGER